MAIFNKLVESTQITYTADIDNKSVEIIVDKTNTGNYSLVVTSTGATWEDLVAEIESGNTINTV